MQLTSVFLVVAVVAFKINNAVALPYIYDNARLNARDIAAYQDDELVARYVPEYYALDARDFGDKPLGTRGPHFHHKIEAEQGVMDAEAKRIKEEQDRLNKQKTTVSLQEQVHKDRMQLRKDSFGRPIAGPTLRDSTLRASTLRGSTLRGSTLRGPFSPSTHGSRFQSKMSSEQGVMSMEEQKIRAQQQRLAAQKNDMTLQEQVHKDRMLLRDGNAFLRR